MRFRGNSRIYLSVLLSLFIAASSFAGQLGDFEKNVNTPRSKKDNDSGGGFFGFFLSDLLFGDSDDEVYRTPETKPTGGGTSEIWDMPPHRLGAASCPYLRIDYNLQYLNTDSFAHDSRLELGYEIAALYARMTRYEDHNTKEAINIDQYYLMLRLGEDIDSEGQTWAGEIAIGLGGYIIDGIEHQNSAMAMTIPIKIYPTDYVGVEFRPAWTHINNRTISDYDISISGGYLYTHLRIGYRWLWVRGDGANLKGPYAGLSIMF